MILAHLHFFFCEMSCLRPVFLVSSLFLTVCQSSLFWILIKYPLHIVACFTFFVSFSEQKLMTLVNWLILSSIGFCVFAFVLEVLLWGIPPWGHEDIILRCLLGFLILSLLLRSFFYLQRYFYVWCEVGKQVINFRVDNHCQPRLLNTCTFVLELSSFMSQFVYSCANASTAVVINLVTW